MPRKHGEKCENINVNYWKKSVNYCVMYSLFRPSKYFGTPPNVENKYVCLDTGLDGVKK